jgi:hypothetical protein
MLQFKLRTLLLAILFIAVLTWLLFVLPDPAGILILGAVLLTIPGVVTAGIVYCRGCRQAFFIGATPMQLLMCLYMMSLFWPFPAYQWPFNEQWFWATSGDLDRFFILKAVMLGSIGVTVVSGAGATLICCLASPRDAPKKQSAVLHGNAAVEIQQYTESAKISVN